MTDPDKRTLSQAVEAIASEKAPIIPEGTKVEFIDDGRDAYDVTKLAGPNVAGHRVEGKTIRLTPAEARDELLAGTIVKPGEQLHEMFTRKGPKPDPKAAKAEAKAS